MRRWLGEAAEIAIGLTYFVFVRAWSVILPAIILLFPLGMAIGLVLVVDGLAPAVALGIGVALGFILDIPPWNAEERYSLPLVVLAATASWVGWNLRMGPADAAVLVVAVAVAIGGWAVRRALGLFRASPHGPDGARA